MGTDCKQMEVGLLLHAYELGILAESDTERFELHLLECDHCFSAVERFAARAELMRSDSIVIQTVHDAVRGELDSEPTRGWLRKYLWPDIPVPIRPAVLLVLILLMIYPTYIGLREFRGGTIRQVQSIILVPARSADTEMLSFSSGKDGVISFVYDGAEPGKAYRVVVEAEDGSILMSDDSFDSFDDYETGQLIFPARLMHKGNYRLIIEPTGDAPLADRQTYKFRVDD